MLRFGPPGEGPTPYNAASACAGHPALVSLDALVERSLPGTREVEAPRRSHPTRVDHDRMLAFRLPLVRRAFERFRTSGGEGSDGFLKFVAANAFWLEDFVLFAALKEASGGKPWSQWEAGVRTRQPRALAEVR